MPRTMNTRVTRSLVLSARPDDRVIVVRGDWVNKGNYFPFLQ
jgi:hypothetical protein